MLAERDQGDRRRVATIDGMIGRLVAPGELMATRDQVGDALCRVLQDGNDVQRCWAAQVLGRIGHRHAVNPLITCLMDEDEDLRGDAADALGRIGDLRAAGPLLHNLVEDPCSEVKVNAVTALSRLGASDAVPLLRRLVRDRCEDEINWDESEVLAGGWDDWLDIQVKAIEALGSMGVDEAAPDIAADIVAAMGDETGQDLSELGLKTLAGLGEPGLAALASFLKAGDERLRRRCAKALTWAEGPASDGLLVQGLMQRDPAVRRAAARALAARNVDDPRLAPLLGDPDQEVRAEVVRLGGPLPSERLHKLLDDPSDAVQAAVVERLAVEPGLRARDLIRRLRVKLRGPSIEVAAATPAALAMRAPEIALADLAEQLQDRNCPAVVRVAAARTLGDMGADEAVAVLAGMLGDEERQVRFAAMVALARLAVQADDGHAACDVLLDALGSELPDPEEEAEEEAQTTEPAPAAPAEPVDVPEAGTSAESSDNVDEVIAGPLWPTSTLDVITGKVPAAPKPSPPREQIELTDEDREYLALARQLPGKRRISPNLKVAPAEDVPRLAARLLGDLAGEGVVSALVAALAATDVELSRAAADSLARIGEHHGRLPPEAGNALIAATRAGAARDLRLAATRALGWTEGKQVAPTLRDLLGDSDPFLRAEAVRALAVLGGGEAEAEIEPLLNDGDAMVRIAAARCIARFSGARARDRLLEFGLAFEGYHCREAGRLLRQVDASGATTRLLAVLGDPSREQRWCNAIEALEEIHRAA